MTYKAIGFDYGGVLTGESGTIQGEKISTILGLPKTTYQEAYYRHNREFNLGHISGRELWAKVLAELDKSDKLDEIMRVFGSTHFGQLHQAMLELVNELRERGYRLGLLSNNSPEAVHKIRQDLSSYFDVLEVSAETGLVKPEPKAFEHFADSLGVQPNELAFIDDSVKSLSTADMVGFTPILFTDHASLLRDLEKLGILS